MGMTRKAETGREKEWAKAMRRREEYGEEREEGGVRGGVSEEGEGL